MMATHVLSEDLPPFSTEVYRESLPKMINKKKTELLKVGFVFQKTEEAAE
jgi:hypothetical protein